MFGWNLRVYIQGEKGKGNRSQTNMGEGKEGWEKSENLVQCGEGGQKGNGEYQREEKTKKRQKNCWRKKRGRGRC